MNVCVCVCVCVSVFMWGEVKKRENLADSTKEKSHRKTCLQKGRGKKRGKELQGECGESVEVGE